MSVVTSRVPVELSGPEGRPRTMTPPASLTSLHSTFSARLSGSQ